MRQLGVVTYLFGDQLGSTSVAFDDAANTTRRQGYTASPVGRPVGGAERYSQGGDLPTRYQYTGQRGFEEVGLYYYGARWYDNALGRFAQADSIIPIDSQGFQAWDRYAYGLNNPSRYTDPTGHKACDGAGVSGDDCEISKSEIIASIYVSYHWNVAGSWTKKELFSLLDAGIAIENKISTLTNGNGRGWMLLNLGDTSFQHSNLAQTTVMGTLNIFNPGGIAGVVPGVGKGHNIFLDNSGINPRTIAHELGHVLDNNTGSNMCAATWCGGGMADALTKFVGGTPAGIRWANSTDSIPDNAKWLPRVDNGYGNNSTADYFAQAFAYLVVDPASLPNPSVKMWMEAVISMQNN